MRLFSSRSVQGDVVRARLDALLAGLDPSGGVVPPEDPVRPEDRPIPAPDAPRRAVSDQRRGVGLRRAWDFSRAHAAVIGVVALVGLLGAVWAITHARTVPVAVAAPTPVAATAAPTAEAPRSAQPTPEPLRVHVLGAVATPGVVRLPPGSRVEDAIGAAGGLTETARPGELNLAAPIADGAQVVVGDARQPGGEVRGPVRDGGAGDPAAPGGAGERLDLNTATGAQLDALPGVGPVTAQAILTWRQQHQRFNRVQELLEIDGIGAKTFERLEPLVRV